MLRYRVFISSPGDVGPERAVALAVAERLKFEFRGQVELEAYLWERSLMRATKSFQEQIADIQQTNLAIFILWSRLGTPLPLDQFMRPDGTQYLSGTEYEFERAMDAHQAGGAPDLLCYLKTAEVRLPLADRAARAQCVADCDAVNAFTDRWFRNPDGTFKSAFYNFQRTAQFEELLEAHLRDWIREQLSAASVAVAQPIWTGSPFRGLQTFNFEHALIYCGRTALVSEILEILKRRGADGRGFLMVTGMSGVGKSSLVRAGVLPMLTRPRVIENVSTWRYAMFKPNTGDEQLLAGFAASLTEKHALPELSSDTRPLPDLLGDPTAFASALIRALDRATKVEHEHAPVPESHGEVRLIILCDQFEELFGDAVTPEQRIQFVEALRGAVTTGRVWVIATLRADLFSRCSELPERFRDLFIDGDGIFTVGGPRPAEISQMIRRPAAIAGLQFETRADPEARLDDVLLDAAAGHPTVLPLLEFTLDELWRRSSGTAVLRFSDYESLGGLHGAIQLRADEVFSSLPKPVQASLPRVLAALVQTDPTNERLVLQNRVPLEQLSGSSETRELVSAFVAAHLFVGDRAADGTPVIGLAHEALLREWPPAVAWVNEHRELLGLRSGVTAAGVLWRNSGRLESRLVRGPLLKDAVRLADADLLPPQELKFVELSIAADRRRRWRWSLIGTAAAAMIALAIFGFDRLSYGLSLAQAMPAAWNNSEEIPVSSAARARLDSSIASLAGLIRSRAAEVATRPELTAWALAQMWAALHDLPSKGIDGPSLRTLVTATRDPGCNCWRETADKLPHTLASAWVLYSLGMYDQAARPEEIDWFLKRQSPQGWWSMFPATPSPGNASTAATAWSVLALHEQLAHKLVSPSQAAEVSAAIDRGAAWLAANAIPGQARWTEYPPDQTFERGKEYLAVSALAIHVLRSVTGTTKFDGLWLKELPRNSPLPGQDELAKGYVFFGTNQMTIDETRHYLYPWMLRTTIDAYHQGTVMERSHALVWLQDALVHAPMAEDLYKEIWTTAEVLYSLQHAKSALHPSKPATTKISFDVAPIARRAY